MKVSFLIPAHNEGAIIAEKIENTLGLSNTGGHEIEVLVISDGSTDDTVAKARGIDDPRLRVVETPGRSGKLKALNQALELLSGDVVIFSDANALLSDGALDAIMVQFGDPHVGGVCGQITVEGKSKGGIAGADALFWRYDQWLKGVESDLGGVVSAQGSIYAMRRHLTGPIPQGVADDFLMSVRGVAQGYRLAFAPQAQTVERVTERVGDEMGRRVRSTEMGWRGLMMMRSVMNPARTGIYAWQLISHKFLRRLMPLFLAVAFLANLALMGSGTGWFVLGLLQILFYALGLGAAYVPAIRRLPLAPKVMFFCMGNLAMALGIWKYYRGVESSVWTPIRDDA
ncbi:glycosyltransferase [Pseudooctadecabacter jejudonensis]|nr:glycosyltransferase [Pseudooctadecabacter jejudonensis]